MNARQELSRRFLAAIERTLERRPVSDQADEGAVSVVDDGNQRVVARFTDGRWRKPGGGDLPIVPTHWLKFREVSDGPA